MVVPGTNGIARFSITGVVVTVDWGSGGGPKVSLNSHYPLFIDKIDGNFPTIGVGSTGTTGSKIGSDSFVSGGFKGGRNSSVKKFSSKLELSVVQTDPE